MLAAYHSCAFLALKRRWTGDAPPRVGVDSLGPHLAPELAPRPILHPVVCRTTQTKTSHLRGFREIAGAGFEPATFGL